MTIVGSSYSQEGVPAIRVQGSNLFHGTSGGPAVNLRTGGVCGLVRLSDREGEGHLEAIDEFLNWTDLRDPSSERWRSTLDDEQITAGKWRIPRRSVSRYVAALRCTVERHPYGLLINESAAPTLGSVYVTQTAERPGAARALAVDISEALADGGTLTADPGGGKSSALRTLARKMCHDFDQGNHARVPILVAAPDLIQSGSLRDAIHGALVRDVFDGESSRAEGLVNLPPAADGEWHLMVDGLDEVLDPDARVTLVRRLISETSATGAFPATLTIAARDYALRGSLDTIRAAKLPSWRLSPFGKREVEQLAQNWFDAAGLAEQDRAQSVQAVLSRFSRDVVSNPLSLSLACQLVILEPRGGNETVRAHHITRSELFTEIRRALESRYFSDRASPFPQIAERTARMGPTQQEAAAHVAESVFVGLSVAALRWISAADGSLATEIVNAFVSRREDHTGDWEAVVRELTTRTGAITWGRRRAAFTHQVLGEHFAATAVAASADLAAESLQLITANTLLAQNDSFLRFALPLWHSDPRFWRWFDESLLGGDQALERVALILEDGVVLPDDTRSRVKRVAEDRLRAVDGEEGGTLRLALRVMIMLGARRAAVDPVWRLVLDTTVHASTRRWLAWGVATLLTDGAAEPPEYEFIDEAVMDMIAASLRALPPVDLRRLPSLEGVLNELSLRSPPPQEPKTQDLVPVIFRRGKNSADYAAALRVLRSAFPRHDLKRVKAASRRAPGQAATARIVAELGLGPDAVAAAFLLRQTASDDYIYFVQENFGERIARVVASVALIDLVRGGASDVESAPRAVIAMARDANSLIVFLADRLQRLRRAGFLLSAEATRLAEDSLYVHADIAQKLGLESMHAEMQDLAFAIMKPKIFAEIEALMRQRFPHVDDYAGAIVAEVEADLRDLRIRARVQVRLKNSYAVYQELVARGRDFDDIYDLLTVLVRTNDMRSCYAMLGALHARWTPLPGRFNDYIATPTYNGYQSLETSVVAIDGRVVQFEITTHEMARYSKQGSRPSPPFHAVPGPPPRTRRASSSSELWLKENAASADFMEALRKHMGVSGLYVFGRGGAPFALDEGATALDLAYAIHSELGHGATSARINGSVMPLGTVLATGDSVEIVSSPVSSSVPAVERLNLVVTRRARRAIRRALSAHGAK
ncbi:TGS domain-containing protein [Microbacterium forte]|uniref:TGS domain-containing protein n=1 Tax=Microbacterium forte TaxID=2982533 RepID=UPI002892E383|nr:TGS domain-containing protein [Microbacterium sp. A(2022)]